MTAAVQGEQRVRRRSDEPEHPTPEPAAAPFPLATLLVILAGTFITFLDFFIVNVAIPSTQRDLHASPAAVQFIVAGYGLALAVGLITGGRLGDMYGRRRMFSIGLAIFTLASAGCGFAPSTGSLIACRVVQGAAAALLTPQVLALIKTIYQGEHRAKAFAAYGLTLGCAGVFGQLIGGALIRADIAGLGWRSIFLINVPIGILAFALTPRLVPESLAGGHARVDLIGSLLISDALAAVVVPLVLGRQYGWPSWTYVCLGVAPVIFLAFIGYERRLTRLGGAPLVDMTMFRERAFSAGLSVALVYCLAQASFFLILALYLQEGRGLSALHSGVLVSVVGVGFFAALLGSEAIATRLGHQVLAVGGILTASGYAVLAATVSHSGVHGTTAMFIPGLLVAGFGMGLVLVPIADTVLAGVSGRHAAAASGVLTTALEVGGAIGVAAVGSLYFAVLGRHVGQTGSNHALAICLEVMVISGLATAVLAQLLPRAARSEHTT